MSYRKPQTIGKNESSSALMHILKFNFLMYAQALWLFACVGVWSNEGSAHACVFICSKFSCSHSLLM